LKTRFVLSIRPPGQSSSQFTSKIQTDSIKTYYSWLNSL